MYQEAKFSRFMFHVKFSQSEEYLNEHELYEIMRSRDLYQSQYALRLNFKKVSRNIAKDEKQTRYGFENSRKLFVRKMQERLEYADKLRHNANGKAPIDNVTKRGNEQKLVIKHERAGMPSLPTARNNIKTKGLYIDENNQLPFLNTDRLPGMRSTSALATVCTSDYGNKIGPNSSGTVRPSTESVINKTIMAGKSDTQTMKKNIPVMVFTSDYENEGIKSTDERLRDGAISAVAKTNKSDGSRSKHSRIKSKLKFSDDFAPNVGNLRGEDKAKAWALKHCLVTERSDNLAQEADLERLLIDRPSKWTLNHYHAGGFVNKGEDATSGIIHGSDQHHKGVSKYPNKKVCGRPELSLPDIHVAPKPMVTLEPGGTTPDGRLVLTKADYEEYLSGYRQARVVRLNRSKQKDEQLEKKIDTFRVEPGLCLRDETSLETALRSI